MRYKYSLEKYNRNSAHICPMCGRQKSFTRYVNNETGEYLDDDVGICNHKKSCRYHYSPKQFFADNPTAANIRSNGFRKRKTASVKITRPSVFDCIDINVFKQTLASYKQNDFVLELLSRFNSEKVTETITKYFVGTWSDGRTVFWQIDEQRRIRTGKLMRFDRETLSRLQNSTNWVHAQLKRNGKLDEKFALKQCMFGEHLLTTEKQKPIGLVESEKNAIIANLFLPNLLWLSVGSNSSLNEERINAIKNRKIVLFPDGEAFDEWTKRARELEKQGFNLVVSDLIERTVPLELRGKGFDIADALIYARENEAKEEPNNNQINEPSICSLCNGRLKNDERRAVKLYFCSNNCPFEYYSLKPESNAVKKEMFDNLEQWKAEALLDALDEREAILIEQGYSEKDAIELTEKDLLPKWIYDYEKNVLTA